MKKLLKRGTALVSAAVLMTVGVPMTGINVYADENNIITQAADTQVTSGKWGTCDWKYENGVLTIGAGKGLSTKKSANDTRTWDVTPWESLNESITEINITGLVEFAPNTSLSGLFRGMINVAQIESLGNLKTGNVTDMSYMFEKLSANDTARYTLMVCDLDTSKVTNMKGMFKESGSFSLNVDNLNISNVTDMSEMFEDSEAVTSLKTWYDTSKVTDMSDMFALYYKADDKYVAGRIRDIKYLDTSNVTNMKGMFYQYSGTSFDISGFDTSKVTDMSGMFQNTLISNLDFSGWDTSNVTNMKNMLSGCLIGTLDLRSFNTSKVTDMSGMFAGGTIIIGESITTQIDVSSFDTSKVTDMSYMFRNRDAYELDLSNFDTSKVTDMSYMFAGADADKIDISSFNTSKVTNMSNMFYGCDAYELDVSSFNTSKVENMEGMFSSVKCEKLDLSGFNTSNVTNMKSMFSSASCRKLDVSGFDTSNVKSMKSMFSGSLLESIDISSFNTSKVTDMSYMFSVCSNLRTINMGDIDTSNVKNMNGMFRKCTSLRTLDIGPLLTDNTETTYDGIFDDVCIYRYSVTTSRHKEYSKSLASKLYSMCEGDWVDKTTGAINPQERSTIGHVYEACTSGSWGTCRWNYNIYNKKLTISGGSAGTYLWQYTDDAPWAGWKGDIRIINITGNIDFNNWDRAVKLNLLFENYVSLEEFYGIDKLDLSKATTVNNMFDGCSKLHTIDVSNMKIGSNVNVSYMFNGCYSLKQIDFSSWDGSNTIRKIFGNQRDNNLEDITMPANMESDSAFEKYMLQYVMAKGKWTDVTAGVQYDDIPESLIGGHRYVLRADSDEKEVVLVKPVVEDCNDKYLFSIRIIKNGVYYTNSDYSKYTYKFIVHNNTTDQWAVLQNYSSNYQCYWKKGGPGDRDFYVDIKDKDGNVTREKIVNLYIEDVKPVASLWTDSEGEIEEGEELSMIASTTLKENVTYKFLIYNPATNQWFKLKDFSSDNKCTWTAGSAGMREFYVDVKDKKGNVYRSKVQSIKVNARTPISVDVTVSDNTVQMGDGIWLRADASGGYEPYTYKVVVYNKTTKTWGLVQNFCEYNYITWTAGSVGDRIFYIDVKDSRGNVKRSAGINVKTTE